MIATFADISITQYYDLISMLDGGNTVGNDNLGRSLSHLAQLLQDKALRLGIHCG